MSLIRAGIRHSPSPWLSSSYALPTIPYGALLILTSFVVAQGCVDPGVGGANTRPDGATGVEAPGETATGGAGSGKGGNGGNGNGSGGRPGSGGAGTAGARGAAGAMGSGGAPLANLCTWPTATGADQMVTATISVSGIYDGHMQRFVGAGALGTSGQTENQPPLFKLASGATLENVILGNPAADGVHCAGTCTLRNVWWEDVGEDAATLDGSSSTQSMTIDGGGANHASDKVFQHNGPGTMVIRNFCVQDFGKLYRSCGNCSTQYARHVQIENVLAIPSGATSALAGVNSNYSDTATFAGIVVRARANSISICQRYTGNDTGAEPTSLGSGPDGAVCMYATSDVVWQ